MKYWIIIDSWNLIETFTTESLSPHNFYLERSFGNDLTRFINKNGELYNNLILYTEEPVANYAIELSDELLDLSLLTKIDNKKKKKIEDTKPIFKYPKTIYFQKNKVRFRFLSKDKETAFIAESKIIYEVKCIEKYIDSFYVDNKASYKPIVKINESIVFNYKEYMNSDKLNNNIKGAIVGYVRGKITSSSIEQQNLILYITDLKNSIAGLNTIIMMGEDPVQNIATYLQKTSICKTKFLEQQNEKTNLFDIIRQLLIEVASLTSKRAEELKKQKTPAYNNELDRFKRKQSECKDKLYQMELEYNLSESIHELKSIKKLELENGKAKGKSREYFKKGTYEHQKKQELKRIIEKFEKENNEYKSLKSELKDIEDQITNYRFGCTKYDSTISALFIRLSDNINDILKKVNTISHTDSPIDLSNISIINGKLNISTDIGNEAERRYFNILLDYVLNYSVGKSNNISDAAILNIISETGKIFNNKEISKTEKENCILYTLREYWKYKNQKTDTFEITNNTPIMQAIISFFIKARGFEQIERFMLNKGFQHKELAFMLWGGLIGYAAIPRTFTNILYSKDFASVEHSIEDFLAKNTIISIQ